MEVPAADHILGVIPANDREETLLLTQEKFKTLLTEHRGRYPFLTPEFVDDLCNKTTWLLDEVNNHPGYYEIFNHIDLTSFVDDRIVYNRLVNFLNRLLQKKIYGFRYFRSGLHYPHDHYFIMRLNLIGFHFFDLRFEPRLV